MSKFLFFPHVPYHANTFCKVINILNGHDSIIIYSDHLKKYQLKLDGDSNIKSIAKKNNVKTAPYHPSILIDEKPDAVIVMCDWGGWPKRMIEDAKSMNIPTIGHVEGAQDYLDTHIGDGYATKRRYPYSRVDFIFSLGDYDKQFFSNKKIITTGSPRFDSFAESNNVKTEKNDVAINCNFSYGLYSDIALDWIGDIVSQVNSLSLKYKISQHIGDCTDLSNYKTADYGIYELINESKILISRFSTVIIEGLLLGRPVIYYNPHGEKQPTFLESLGSFPTPKTKIDLKKSIEDVIINPEKWLERSKDFLDLHVGYYNGGSSERFAKELIRVGQLKSNIIRKFLFRSNIIFNINKIFRKFS